MGFECVGQLLHPSCHKEREKEAVKMNSRKKKRLTEDGWKVGIVSEFLNLSEEENASIENRTHRPNARTRKAIRDGNCGKGKELKTAEEPFRDLNSRGK